MGKYIRPDSIPLGMKSDLLGSFMVAGRELFQKSTIFLTEEVFAVAQWITTAEVFDIAEVVRIGSAIHKGVGNIIALQHAYDPLPWDTLFSKGVVPPNEVVPSLLKNHSVKNKLSVGSGE